MQINDTTMNYESIYEGYYLKYYSKAEFLIKNFLVKRYSQKKAFGNSYNEVIHYLSNDFVKKYNLYANKNLEYAYRIFGKRHSIYFIDEVQEIFKNEIKIEFDKINTGDLPANYTYHQFIKEVALIEAVRQILRLFSNHERLHAMVYELNEFDKFEIKVYGNLALEDYPNFKILHAKLYPKPLEIIVENVQLEVFDSEEIDLNDSTTTYDYLGQSSNEKANELFDFLIQYYRPDEKTSVKFVNILHYLKNDANKELYIFNIKQLDFKEIIKTNFKIEIKKFAKSERYHDDEKSILNTLESSFRNKKS
jgi:hypothetical protein